MSVALRKQFIALGKPHSECNGSRNKHGGNCTTLLTGRIPSAILQFKAVYVFVCGEAVEHGGLPCAAVYACADYKAYLVQKARIEEARVYPAAAHDCHSPYAEFVEEYFARARKVYAVFAAGYPRNVFAVEVVNVVFAHLFRGDYDARRCGVVLPQQSAFRVGNYLISARVGLL